MHIVTFDYSKPIIAEATQNYKDALERFRLEELASPDAGVLAYLWMDTVVKWLFISLPIALILSLIVSATLRLTKEGRGDIGPLIPAAEVYFSAVIAVLLAIFLVDSLFLGDRGRHADALKEPEEPDYSQLVEETVSENRDEIDSAIEAAAGLAGIDLAQACNTGRSAPPAQSNKYDYSTVGKANGRLLQCGGDEFGSLLFADLESGEAKTVSTSTGAERFIVATGVSDIDGERGRELSSVSFDGVGETEYKQDKDRPNPWPVDEGDVAELGAEAVPYDKSAEMDLETALESAGK
jgi:hypothetical protein